MHYVLTHPLAISARLLPAVRVDDSWISLDLGNRDNDERLTSRLFIDTPSGEIYDNEGPSSGCYQSWADESAAVADLMASALAFLSADAETYSRHMGASTPDDGYLFGETVAEWAYGVSDELDAIRFELEGDES